MGDNRLSEPRPEFHLHDDFSLTPSYALGYAFHALGRIDEKTSAHGRRGAIALLTELLATLTALKLDASVAAAEPLRIEQEALSRSRPRSRVGAASAAQVLAALVVVEEAVRSELRVRGLAARPVPEPPSYSLQVLLGETALDRCPDALRCEVTDACRALDAQLYTAAVFHLCRVWEQLPGSGVPAADSRELTVVDPRIDPACRCTKAEALSLLRAVRTRLV